MTQEEIISMAREAGFDEHHAQFDLRLERFAKLVAEKEREEILSLGSHNWYKTQKDFEEAIRARGQQ